MTPQKILVPELLGKSFKAVTSSIEDTLDFETKKINGKKLNISIQDPTSPAYLELISVKIRNVNTSLSQKDIEKSPLIDVDLVNLKIGIWNNQLTFSADDIVAKQV